MILLRRYAVLLICLAFVQQTSAQTYFNWKNKYTSLDIGRNNIIKVNLPSLYYSTLSLNWERLQQQRRSYSLGLRWTAPSRLPGMAKFEEQLKNVDPSITVGGPITFFTRARVGGWAFTADRRFYLGKKTQAGRGVYIAPMFRAETFGLKTNLSGNFTNSDRSYSIDFRGRLSSIGAGIGLGVQFFLGPKVTLDWGLTGGYFKYNFLGAQATSYDFGFTPTQLADIDTAISDLKNGLIKFTASVSNQKIKFNTAFPMPAVRTYFSIGYRFMDNNIYRYE
jgi:hypothetical protein